jgi:hypothetical protein
MSFCFPLYDNLFSSEAKKSLSKDEKRALVQNVAKLDRDGHHKIAALILYYQITHDSRKVIQLSPILNINISDLPAELQVRLEMFVFKHLEFMREMDQRKNAAALGLE